MRRKPLAGRDSTHFLALDCLKHIREHIYIYIYIYIYRYGCFHAKQKKKYLVDGWKYARCVATVVFGPPSEIWCRFHFEAGDLASILMTSGQIWIRMVEVEHLHFGKGSLSLSARSFPKIISFGVLHPSGALKNNTTVTACRANSTLFMSRRNARYCFFVSLFVFSFVRLFVSLLVC